MYSSSCVSTRLVLIPILAVVATQLLLMRTVLSLNMTNAYLNHKCYVSQGKYKPGTGYDKNLKSIIRKIVSEDGFHNGFVGMSTGKDLASVGVLLECRGDSYGSKCRSCFATAVAWLHKRCPRYKGGVIWYDQCVLEISTSNTGKINKDNNFCMSNPKKMNVDSFGKKWMIFLDKLGSTINYSDWYAAGDTRFGTKKLYGMVQCRVDIPNDYKDCQPCLRNIAMQFQDCWNGKQGARVFSTTCNFRFELYPFVSNKSSPNELKF